MRFDDLNPDQKRGAGDGGDAQVNGEPFETGVVSLGKADADLSIEAVCRALRRTLLRAGLLLATDPQPALEAVLGSAVSRESVRANEDARDLVFFWTSTDALSMRRELGLT